MKLEIIYTDTARKQLKQIDRQAAKRIFAKINQYAQGQSSLTNQIKSLKGDLGFRLRVGNYRVIFNQDGIVLTVFKVGHRKDIYR